MKALNSSSLTQVARDTINGNFLEGDDRLVELEAQASGNNVSIQYAPSATTDGIEAFFQVVNASGAPKSGRHTLNIWVSDDEFGDGLTATAASGALTVVWGTTLIVHTAKKHLMLNTDGTGLAKLLLVDSANTAGERFCCTDPVTGRAIVGSATVSTDYEGGV